MITQRINLDLIPSGVRPIVYVNQYDAQSGAFIFSLFSGGTVFTIPEAASVVIEGHKPDMTAFVYACESFVGSTVTVACEQQMTAVAGDTECELRIRLDTGGGTEIIGTTNFILRVEPAALNDDSVISETMIPLIEQAVDIAADLAAYIETAVESAATASEAAETATDAASEASIYNANVLAAYNSLEDAKTAANTAATAANTAAASLSGMSATAITLDPGEEATVSYNGSTKVFSFGIPTGPAGASGITTPLDGFFSLYCDEYGDLYVVWTGDGDPPAFWYDEPNGDLYYFVGSYITTESGAVLAVYAEAFEALDVSAEIVPVQSGTGTPSPSNARPISGWDSVTVYRTGKNLKNLEFSQLNSANIITNTFALKAGTYTLSMNYSGTPTWGVYLRNGRTINSPVIKQAYNVTTLTFTLDKNYSEMCVTMYYENGITVAEVTNIQLELGSTATSYEPYNGTSYSVSLSSAGTVYGGSLDVTTGVLTVTHKGIDIKTLSYAQHPNNSTVYYASIADKAFGVDNLLSDMFSVSNASVITLPNGTMRGVTSNSVVYFSLNVPTVEEFVNHISGTLVYELATPQTYTLTGEQIQLLAGANTVYADTGDITLKYVTEEE